MDTIKYLTEEVQRFCEDRDWDQFHGPKDLAIGLSTESTYCMDFSVLSLRIRCGR